MNKESFVYLWYDSRNKMFYLGKHKGTPDDGYTHWQQRACLTENNFNV